jgi:hypothetical protein
MAFFTKEQFEVTARTRAGARGLTGLVSETRTFAKLTSTTSIFLSHSHHDKAQIEQAKIFFENLGFSIYVDWADETMPEKTNGVTAQKIKTKINSNDKFIFLATNNAVSSKWCNWEVGIGDTYKLQNEKIALLPLADNNGTWNGNEYLQIYPRIEKSAENSTVYEVIKPNGTKELLSQWLRK